MVGLVFSHTSGPLEAASPQWEDKEIDRLSLVISHPDFNQSHNETSAEYKGSRQIDEHLTYRNGSKSISARYEYVNRSNTYLYVPKFKERFEWFSSAYGLEINITEKGSVKGLLGNYEFALLSVTNPTNGGTITACVGVVHSWERHFDIDLGSTQDVRKAFKKRATAIFCDYNSSFSHLKNVELQRLINSVGVKKYKLPTLASMPDTPEGEILTASKSMEQAQMNQFDGVWVFVISATSSLDSVCNANVDVTITKSKFSGALELPKATRFGTFALSGSVDKDGKLIKLKAVGRSEFKFKGELGLNSGQGTFKEVGNRCKGKWKANREEEAHKLAEAEAERIRKEEEARQQAETDRQWEDKETEISSSKGSDREWIAKHGYCGRNRQEFGDITIDDDGTFSLIQFYAPSRDRPSRWQSSAFYAFIKGNLKRNEAELVKDKSKVRRERLRRIKAEQDGEAWNLTVTIVWAGGSCDIKTVISISPESKKKEEEARKFAEAEAERIRKEEEARQQAEAEAERIRKEEEARKLAEAEAERIRKEEEARKLAESERNRKAEEARQQAEAEHIRKEEEVAQQAEADRLEREKLATELAALKEALRDHLAGAFMERSQEEREEIQQRLAELGFYTSAIDGAFGEGTRSAIKSYASSRNLVSIRTLEGAQTAIAELVDSAAGSTAVKVALSKGRIEPDLSEIENARDYMEDVKSFVKLNPDKFNKRVLASSFHPATKELEGQTPGKHFLKLVAHGKTIATFREYRETKNLERYENEEKRREEIVTKITNYLAALEKRIAKDPLAPDAFQLNQLLQKYENFPTEADSPTLTKFHSDLKAEANSLGIVIQEEARKLAEADRLEREKLAAELAALKKKEEARKLAEAERIGKEEEARQQAEAERLEREKLEEELDALKKKEGARELAEKDRQEKERLVFRLGELMDALKKKEEARKLAEAERIRREEETRQQAAADRLEREKLAAELAGLKEAQRDHLAGAFMERGQEEREQIQRGLAETGFYTSAIDGAFGEGTRSAIKSYATSRNLVSIRTPEGATAAIAELVDLATGSTEVKIALPKERVEPDLSKIENARDYIADIRSFASVNKDKVDTKLIARSFKKALAEINSQEFNKPGSHFLKLVAYGNTNWHFQEFRNDRNDTRYANEQKKREELTAKITKYLGNLEAQIDADPFAEDADELIALTDRYRPIPITADSQVLAKLHSDLKAEAEALGIVIAVAPADTQSADLDASPKDEGAQTAIEELDDLAADSTEVEVALSKERVELDLSKIENARNYMEDIKSFSSMNRDKVDTKVIARSFKKALAEINSQEFNKLGSHFRKLVTYGNTNSYFQEFRNDRNDTRYANEQKKREELVANITKYLGNLEARIDADPFAEDADELIALTDRYRPIPITADSQVLAKLHSDLKAEAVALGIAIATDPADTQSANRDTSPEDVGAQTAIEELDDLAAGSTEVKVDPKRVEPNLSKIENARDYMEDIRSFSSMNRDKVDTKIIARSFKKALAEIDAQEFSKPGSHFLKLVAYGNANSYFQEFRNDRNDTRYANEQKKREELVAEITKYLGNLEARIDADPFAEDADELIALTDRYRPIPIAADSQVLTKLHSDLKAKAEALGVVIASGSADTQSADPSALLIKSLGEIEELVEIGTSDIAVLINFEKAPHALRSLSGKVEFEGNMVKACSPSLEGIDIQFRTFIDRKIEETLRNHVFIYESSCAKDLNGFDALIVTGADLAKSDAIPAPEFFVNGFENKALLRFVLVKTDDFKKELEKRDIMSSQYKNDIAQEARIGFGAVSLDSDSQVGCVVVESDQGHDKALKSVSSEHQFSTGVYVDTFVYTSVDVAFKEAQRGKCGFIYSSAKNLKTILDRSVEIRLSLQVLPLWISPSSILARAEQLSRKQKETKLTEGEHAAAVKRQRAEEEARLAAEAAQLEQRQMQYRSRNGAKVESLVATIDSGLKDTRSDVDAALSAKQNLKNVLRDLTFWGDVPGWYADKRMKGWEFESTVPSPKDYGIARWDGREIEAVTARIRILMKNRVLGEYSDTCWHVGYLIDSEFSMNREPFTEPCEEMAKLTDWQARNGFETRWDLGVQ